MQAAWAWLTENSAAVTAAATVLGIGVGFGGVVVAAVYAWLTHRLAEAATEQATLTAQIAEQTRQHGDLNRVRPLPPASRSRFRTRGADGSRSPC